MNVNFSFLIFGVFLLCLGSCEVYTNNNVEEKTHASLPQMPTRASADDYVGKIKPFTVFGANNHLLAFDIRARKKIVIVDLIEGTEVAFSYRGRGLAVRTIRSCSGCDQAVVHFRRGNSSIISLLDNKGEAKSFFRKDGGLKDATLIKGKILVLLGSSRRSIYLEGLIDEFDNMRTPIVAQAASFLGEVSFDGEVTRGRSLHRSIGPEEPAHVVSISGLGARFGFAFEKDSVVLNNRSTIGVDYSDETTKLFGEVYPEKRTLLQLQFQEGLAVEVSEINCENYGAGHIFTSDRVESVPVLTDRKHNFSRCYEHQEPKLEPLPWVKPLLVETRTEAFWQSTIFTSILDDQIFLVFYNQEEELVLRSCALEISGKPLCEDRAILFN